MGIKTLRKMQMGKEATPGNKVAATTIWRGIGAINDERELQFVEEDIGSFVQPDAAYIPKIVGGVTMEEVDLTFEQLPYILSAGIKNVTTGVLDAGNAYVYEYPMPMTTANTIKTYTIEFGDDEAAEVVNYAFVKELTISGSAGEALKMGAEWMGSLVEPQAFTPTLTVPTVEIALFGNGKFYIDDVPGTLGTSRKTATLLGFEFSVSSGWLERYTCDDTLGFYFIRGTRPEVTLTLTMEHNTTSIDEKLHMRAGDPRLIRLAFTGSALTGTEYTKKTILIDVVGKYTAVPSMDDEDGDNTLEFELTGIYHSAALTGPNPFYARVTVVNSLASLP